jgi:glycosyltransferase involved in cell wall biosynthesis
MEEAPFPHYSFGEQVSFPNLIQECKADLFFSPHFNVPLSCSTPFVCTVHDFILHRYPNQASFLKRMAYRLILGRAVRGASSIITVSEASKNEIQHFYGSSAERKTVVAYPGIDKAFVPQSKEAQDAMRKQYQLERPYLIYVGNCKEHKNVPVLLDAFAKANLPGIDLVVVASGRECASLGRRPNVRFLAAIPHEDLPALYSGALGCVTATKLEGFCLPVVEAMACNCPVLATTVEPLPEVCGSHAMLVEPTVSAFSKGLQLFVADGSIRDQKKLDAARQWVEKYSWEVAAEKVAHTFSDVLSTVVKE